MDYYFFSFFYKCNKFNLKIFLLGKKYYHVIIVFMIKKQLIKEQIVSVNTFDLSDYIICIHKKKNIPLSLCKLQSIIFFYQIVSKTTHVIPFVDDDFILKDDFIYLQDIKRKYRKYKKLDIAKLNIPNKPASFASFGSAHHLLIELTLYFENYSNRLIKKLLRKMPIYQKLKDKASSSKKKIFVKMEKKDFIKYYPLKRWEDGYNMIIDIDDKIPLFRL